MSGRGPYFGQAAWFARFHPERIPSATDRYKDQIKRVFSVLDTHLKGKHILLEISGMCNDSEGWDS
jgi:glutathione S-transferase